MALFSESLLTQLYEDAPFWWYLKDQALFSPVHNAESVSELDDRLNAMLNMLAQADNWNHNPAEHIALDEKGGVFAHSWLGLHQQKETIWQPVADAIDNIELSDEFAFD